MIKFSQILEAKASINFIRYFIDWEDYDKSYFQFVNKKSLAKDKREINIQSGAEVHYFDFKSNYEKTIFLLIIKDDTRDYHIRAYNDIYKAFSEALKLYNEEIKTADDGYDIKIFKFKIDQTIDKYMSDEEFWKDNHLIYCEYNKEPYKNEINMKPEYAHNDKIKNMVLSSKTIGKFKL